MRRRSGCSAITATLVVEKTTAHQPAAAEPLILDPELEAKIPSRKLDYPGQLQRISQRLRDAADARSASRASRSNGSMTLTREAEATQARAARPVRAHRPELLAETGCGPLCAAILIGQTAGAERFASDAHFARVAGVAPIPVSSGRQTVTDSIAAATANSTAPCTSSRSHADAWTPRPAPTSHRKEAEGKSRIEAMRCLKRHLARHYHHLLQQPAPARHESIAVNSTICIPCLT